MEKRFEDSGEFSRIDQIDFKHWFMVLVENGVARILKDGIGDGITCGDLLADFSAEVVSGVLGFPVATREIEAIAQRTIGSLAIGQRLFGNEHPVRGLGKRRQQVMKRGSHCRFVRDLFLVIGREFLVVVVNRSLLCSSNLHTTLAALSP